MSAEGGAAADFKVGLLGHGTVGSAFAALLEERAGGDRALQRPQAGDQRRADAHRAGSFEEILAEADLLVELIGGIEPAREYLLRAMRAGKDVVSANKQLLSQHGEELFETAREHGVRLRFEAAVAGAVPVVRVLEESLSATPIERIHGIVNGTTNFILTEMARRLELRRGARRGAAHAATPRRTRATTSAAATRPRRWRSSRGWRSARRCTWTTCRYEGIEHLHGDDLRVRARARPRPEADRHRRAPRRRAVGARASRRSSTPGTRSPRSRARSTPSPSSPRRSPRSRCPGPGAGGPQTASAVLGDVVSVMTGGARPPAPPLPLQLIEDVESAFYLHLDVADRPGVLAAVTQVLGEHERLDQVGRAARHGRARAAGDGHPPGARVEPARGRRAGRRVRLRALAAADDPRDRRGVRMSPRSTSRSACGRRRRCRCRASKGRPSRARTCR